MVTGIIKVFGDRGPQEILLKQEDISLLGRLAGCQQLFQRSQLDRFRQVMIETGFNKTELGKIILVNR